MTVSKVVSFNKLDDIINFERKKNKFEKSGTLDFDVNGKTVSISVKDTLSLEEMCAFVNGVVDAVFDGDIYYSALLEPTIAKHIIAFYTDIKDDISNERLVSIIYETDILDLIRTKINEKQFKHMTDSILVEINDRKTSINDSRKTQLEDAIKQMDNLISMFDTLGSQLSDINVKETLEAAKILSKKDEKELVNAILDRQETRNE